MLLVGMQKDASEAWQKGIVKGRGAAVKLQRQLSEMVHHCDHLLALTRQKTESGKDLPE